MAMRDYRDPAFAGGAGPRPAYTVTMFTVRNQLRRFVWLALAAMLATAALPTVARVLASSQNDAAVWAEICTLQGMQRVAVDGTPAGDTAPAAGGDHQQDCPYCRLSSTLAGLPPPPLTLALLPAGGTPVPPLFLHAPRTLFAWASAQPRAPPSLS